MPAPLPTTIHPDLTFADFQTEERARSRARIIVERAFLAGGSLMVETYVGANAEHRIRAAMLDLKAVPDEGVRTILLSHHIQPQAEMLLTRHEATAA